jgi:hypothetical protein
MVELRYGFFFLIFFFHIPYIKNRQFDVQQIDSNNKKLWSLKYVVRSTITDLCVCVSQIVW